MKIKLYSFYEKIKSRLTVLKSGEEDGSAMVLALFIMILLLGFVALAVSRTASETIATSNDASESRAFDAAHASLEIMTRNFNKIFETKLNVEPADITRIQGQKPPGFQYADVPPGSPYYKFDQLIASRGNLRQVVLTEGGFQGLTALQDKWELDTTATDEIQGTQVQMKRYFLNNRIPIFQFGIFYDDDLEFHPGPRFDFGGRVHSNGHMFLMAQTGLFFSSKVTTRGQVITDIGKNGAPWTSWGEEVHIKNAAGNFRQLRNTMGSALANTVNGTPVTSGTLPTTYRSASWPTNEAVFDKNLLAEQPSLDLPLKLNSVITGTGLTLRELVKRGKAVGDVYNNGTGTPENPSMAAVTAATGDDQITSLERYYNKTGIRINLADRKEKLPGCAQSTGIPVTTPCGVQLDQVITTGPLTGSRGYEPRAMAGSPAYRATPLNGERLYTGPGRESWIKIETVVWDPGTVAFIIQDITEDILSLGVTEAAPQITTGTTFGVTSPSNYYTNGIDTRSIVKLQRFMMPITTGSAGFSIPNTTGVPIGTFVRNQPLMGGATRNFVHPATVPNSTNCSDTANTPVSVFAGSFPDGRPNLTDRGHWRNAEIGTPNTTVECVVPFPINMFDTREGLYNDTDAVFNPTAAWTAPHSASKGYGQKVPWAGVMSMIDIDIANLRRLMRGDFDTNMPAGTPFATLKGRPLRARFDDSANPSDIPAANGWVLYISDRRGDYDFDGEYDMEDVFGPNDGTLQPGENVNFNRTAPLPLGVEILDASYRKTIGLPSCNLCEGVRYNSNGYAAGPKPVAPVGNTYYDWDSVSPDIAAVYDHPFYRRGVRLVNGTQLPGVYDSVTPGNTRGFTVASENAVYVQGNYNSTGVANATGFSIASQYLPQNTPEHIPASIAADAVMILSNNWQDARSFTHPFAKDQRTTRETTVRTAILTGDAITSLTATPNQGGGNPRMSGGVHNFKRFLEDWTGTRLNYSGSLINLFNSANNNGTFKCCFHVYDPPDRNWVFDVTFLDINRIPPGTPFFQSIQITGFQRVN